MEVQFFRVNRTGADNAADFLYIHQNPSIGIVYLVVSCVATFAGTIGNIMVIGAVFCNKKLKKVGNMLIVNLAIADLCVSAFVNPFSIVGVVEGEEWFTARPMLCETVASICLTSCFCSLLSIGAISFNRYMHICHHAHYNTVYTLRNSLAICFGIWTVSFLLELPNFLGWGDHVYDHKTLTCIWDRTADFSYTLFFALIGVGFPVILISICYLKIYLFVKEHKRKVAVMIQTGSNVSMTHARRESMRLARTLFIIFIVFTICWTPYAIIVVADVRDDFSQELHIFSILIAHANSSLNSILYGLADKNFREGYMYLLGIHHCRKSICPKVSFINGTSEMAEDVANCGEVRNQVRTVSSAQSYRLTTASKRLIRERAQLERCDVTSV